MSEISTPNLDKAKQLFLSGLEHFNQRQYTKALHLFEESLKLAPNRESTLTNLAATLIRLDKNQEAKILCDELILTNPQNLEAHLNLGLANHNLKNYQEALLSFNKAIGLDPDHPETWSNKGITLNSLKQYDEALIHYDKAIQLKPHYSEAWSNKGNTLNELNRHDEALIHYDQAIQLKPDYFDSYWNKSLTCLAIEDFHHGWNLYDYRWKKSEPTVYRHGELNELTSLNNLSQKNILVWYEQGYGDTIQFSRYVSELIKMGAIVTFEVQKPLLNIFRNHLDCMIVDEAGSKEKFDFQVPLMSLPKLFNTNISNIPQPILIKPSQEHIHRWREKLDLSDRQLNIGIATSGNPNHKNDLNRSMPLSYLSPLVDHAKFFLIQKELNPIDQKDVSQIKNIVYLGDQINDFVDTASIIENLDLVISVDTSLIHLAGSLNKNSYLMLPWCPEWRWLLERVDSPWYPSIKIFRQESIGNWNSVIQKIKHAILNMHDFYFKK